MYNLNEKNLTEVLATYRATLPVVEDYQERDVTIFAEDVKRFMIEQEKMTEDLIEFKETLGDIQPIKEQETQYYSQFSDFLGRYEESRSE